MADHEVLLLFATIIIISNQFTINIMLLSTLTHNYIAYITYIQNKITNKFTNSKIHEYILIM